VWDHHHLDLVISGMGKDKASAALFDQLQKAIESGEGEDIVGKMKVWIAASSYQRSKRRHKP
jgi:hypothetical protein